jgi:serine/threonine-protein kinase
LAVGTEVAGYRIEGVLGRGGMGVVYQAVQLSLGRTVALKVLAPERGADPGFRQRFRREGQIQAGIDHPHIVTVYEAGEIEDGLFLAMRLVRGSTLKDLIVGRELEGARTLRLLRQIADALDAAHAASLTHRDIKPQNILVEPTDRAFLADFGLTKGLEESGLTSTGQFVGTVDYVCPEQIRGEPAGPASDIYALAAVLYECLTGVVPYPKPSDAAVLYAHMSDPPPRVSDQRPELPAALDDVIARAMAKDPRSRHASAIELIEDAERAFGRRARAVITPPGPIEVPEELGIRPAERKVPTRPSHVRPRAEAFEEAVPAKQRPPAVANATPPATGAQTRASTVGAVAAGEAGSGTDLPEAAKPPAASGPSGRPRPAPRARRGSTVVVATLAIVVAAAGAGGFLAGNSGSSASEPPALANSVSNADIAMSYPSRWRRVDRAPAIKGLRFSGAIAVAVGDPTVAGLIAGRLRVGGADGARGADLLPEGFARRARVSTARADRVRLGSAEALRYRGLTLPGSATRLTLYVVPASVGVATAACYFAPGSPSGLAAECERIATSLTLVRGRAYPVDPSPAYASALSATFRTLATARAGPTARLRAARTSSGQARAIEALARAYGQAARTLGRRAVSPAILPAHGAIVRALEGSETAFNQLTVAARRGERRRYRAAASTVRRQETAVRRALLALRRAGYATS